MENTNVFGLSQKLKKGTREIAGLEVAFGFLSLLFSLFCFFMFVLFFAKNSWGKTIFEYIGIDIESLESIKTLFLTTTCLLGVLYLGLSITGLLSGFSMLKCPNNPVYFLNLKKTFLIFGIVYITFSVLLFIAFFLAKLFWIFIALNSVLFLMSITLSILKFLVSKKLPDKLKLLDVENLNQKEKEAVLSHSNINSFK